MSMLHTSFTRRKLLAAGTAVPLTLAFRIAGAAQTFKAYTYLPSATNEGVIGMTQMFARLAKETQGEVNVELNLGGSLPIKGNNITQAVGQSIVQFGDDGFFAGAVPQAGALRLPMLIQSTEEFHRASAAVRQEIDTGFEKLDVTVIGRYLYPVQVMFGRVNIASLDDVRGKKMRVTSPEQGEFIKRLGGTPITIPTPEVAAALERGVVDGILTASTGGGIFYKDLLTCSYRFGSGFFDSMFIANTAMLNGLSAVHRAVVLSATADACKAIDQMLAAREPKVTQQLADGGMKINLPTKQDNDHAARLMADYWDSWATTKGAAAKTIVQKIRSTLGR